MDENDNQQDNIAPLAEWTTPDGLRYEALENPPLDILREVNRGLDAYNRPHIGDYSYTRLGVFAFDSPERRTLIGGVFGDLLWDWLHIDSLWVRANPRQLSPGAIGKHA